MHGGRRKQKNKIKEIKQEGKSPVIRGAEKKRFLTWPTRVWAAIFFLFFFFNFPKVGPYANLVD